MSSSFTPIGDIIPGVGHDASSFEAMDGCECEEGCTSEKGCACLRFGRDNYDGEGRLMHNDMPYIVECSSSCSCSLACRNRVIQHGVKCNVKLVNTQNKGIGLQSVDDLPPNSFICSYIGEVIGVEEMARRDELRLKHKQRHSYIMRVEEHVGEDTIINTIIDPTIMGNIGRYINHSCSPNMRRVIYRFENSVARVAFFTKHAVVAGEELTYFYDNRTMNSTDDPDVQGKTCECGADGCKGVMPNDAISL